MPIIEAVLLLFCYVLVHDLEMVLRALIEVFNVILVTELPVFLKEFEHILIVKLPLFVQFFQIQKVFESHHRLWLPVSERAADHWVDP